MLLLSSRQSLISVCVPVDELTVRRTVALSRPGVLCSFIFRQQTEITGSQRAQQKTGPMHIQFNSRNHTLSNEMTFKLYFSRRAEKGLRNHFANSRWLIREKNINILIFSLQHFQWNHRLIINDSLSLFGCCFTETKRKIQFCFISITSILHGNRLAEMFESFSSSLQIEPQ